MDLEGTIDSDSSNENEYDDAIENAEADKGEKRNRYHVEDDENENVNGKAGKKKLKFSSHEEFKELSKPATAEELNRLRETENLFHSNLFRLQIEEMLNEVKLKQKYKTDFQKWFEKFHKSMRKLDDGDEEHRLSNMKWFKATKVKIPLPKVPQVVKGIYRFRKPLSIEVVGSYSLETLIGPKVSVDVVVELPQEFYKKEDFSNCGYHVKRALYLCELVNHIEKLDELVKDVNFISDEIDILSPRIELIPRGNLGSHVCVMLSVIVDRCEININRFRPSENNVKAKWFFGQNVLDESVSKIPTPFYNNTILADITMKDNYKFLCKLLERHKNLKDGIILLKVWLRQRELTSCSGSFSGFLMALLVCYLLENRKLNSYMSSYQVVRTVFSYLASNDLTKNGITLFKTTNDNSEVPSMTEFHEHFDVVFVDVTGYHNLCYGIHSSTYLQIQHEARIALNSLDDPSVNSFQILFMKPVPFSRHFDHVITFHNEEALENIVDVYSPTEARLNHCGVVYPQLVSMIYSVLKKGFRERVSHLCVRQPRKTKWKPEKKFKRTLAITFGLCLHPENYLHVVDKAAPDETHEFREFWGERSELRRFQDGTITEAVVWNAETFSKKRLICRQITSYLMKLKFELDRNDFQYFADQFDRFIEKDVEESTMNIIEVAAKLNKQLRNLKNLPLDVVSVQGASPVFRYTEMSPMSSAKRLVHDEYDCGQRRKRKEALDVNMVSTPDFVNPNVLVLQMGATNKWPQDLGAIKRLRTAFYIKIAQSLKNQYNIEAQVFTDRVELIEDGFVFHLRIFCPNEIGLTKMIIEDGLVKYRDNPASTAVEKELVLLPKLTSALHGLYEQHSSFGPAACLVKRWVNSQMIDSSHISEEVLDMLVASLYLKPTPNDVPHQPQVAFLRFLHMMASTDWNCEFIVLNINNELDREDILEIESHFTTHRDLLPALFIATPYDRNKSIWTRDSPTPLVLLRLVQLCGRMIEIIDSMVYKNVVLEEEVGALFKPSLDPYNVIIHLHPNHNPKARRPEGEVDSGSMELPVNGFDPAAIYVKELRDSYDDIALFFYDGCGGSAVGVVWKPGIEEPKDFKVENMTMRKYDLKTKNLHMDMDLIVEDFLIIGKGLVRSIDVKKNGEMKSITFW